LSDGYLAAYEMALDKIEQIKSADSLSEVFILDLNYHYLVTTSLDEDSVYYPVSLNREAIDSAFFSSEENYSSVSASYQTDNLILKSAFAPLYDSSGQVIAVLGMEADVDYADNLFSLRQSLYISTVISVGVGILFGFIFFMIQKRIGSTERAIILSQSQANLGRMVAVVSHEIKNPLMIMRASAESLKKACDKAEADFILEEVDRLNQIVTGYLDFASGKMVLKREPVNIVELISEIVDKFAPRLNEKNIKLSFNPDEENNVNLVATADQIAMRQVIINLILNASEALADTTNPEISINILPGAKNIQVIVGDNGPGIGAKDIKSIFEPFYTTKTKGSGLGLYHTRKLMEAMDGKINVESGPKNQTTFVLSLPIADKGQ
jgi:signal transduction histidine kinase